MPRNAGTASGMRCVNDPFDGAGWIFDLIPLAAASAAPGSVTSPPPASAAAATAAAGAVSCSSAGCAVSVVEGVSSDGVGVWAEGLDGSDDAGSPGVAGGIDASGTLGSACAISLTGPVTDARGAPAIGPGAGKGGNASPTGPPRSDGTLAAWTLAATAGAAQLPSHAATAAAHDNTTPARTRTAPKPSVIEAPQRPQPDQPGAALLTQGQRHNCDNHKLSTRTASLTGFDVASRYPLDDGIDGLARSQWRPSMGSNDRRRQGPQSERPACRHHDHGARLVQQCPAAQVGRCRKAATAVITPRISARPLRRPMTG